jgi:hypothetical protein
MQKKRKRENVDEGPHRRQATALGDSSSKEKGPIDIESNTEPTSDESKVSKSMDFADDSYPPKCLGKHAGQVQGQQ